MRNRFFKRLHRRILAGCVAFLFVSLAASLSWASTIFYNVSGVSIPGISATVRMEYTPGATGEAEIEFGITNTSSVLSDITGFAFNVPDPDDVTGVASFSGITGWSELVHIDAINENPPEINTPGNFGFFDVAGVTGSNLNGGNVNVGIEPGDGEIIFTFVLLGDTTFLNGIDTSAFNIPSALKNGNGSAQPILVRFQGIGPDGELSDVATVIPIPSAILLLGSGILGLAGLRKKFICRG